MAKFVQNNLTFRNNQKVIMGNSSQAQIKYDGTDLIISTTSGDLSLEPAGEILFNGPINIEALTVGTDDVANGLISVYGDSGTVGGQINIYNAANDDGDEEYYIIRANNEHLNIGPVSNPDSLSYLVGQDAWYFTGGTLNLGVHDTQRGTLDVNSGASGVLGGAITLQVSPDHDNDVTTFEMRSYEDELRIGPGTGTDRISFDAADATWTIGDVASNRGYIIVDKYADSLYVYGGGKQVARLSHNGCWLSPDPGVAQLQVATSTIEGTLGSDIVFSFSSALAVLRTNTDIWGSLDIGRETISNGSLDIFGGPTGQDAGGHLRIHTSDDYDGTIPNYTFQTNQDDLLIGPSSDEDALKYDGGLNEWQFRSLDGGPQATFGQDGQINGNAIIYLYGDDSGDGGEVRIFTGAAYDSTIDYYKIFANRDDLQIGPINDEDSLIYDGGTGQWQFTGTGGVDVSGGDLIASHGQVDIGGPWGSTSQAGILYVHNAGTGNIQGGKIRVYGDWDGGADAWDIQVIDDHFMIGTSSDTDKLEWDPSLNKWIFNATTQVYSTFEVGAQDLSNGTITIYAQDSQSGGRINIEVPPAYDTTIASYSIRSQEDDLEIGPSTDLDALKYDGGLNQWIFSSSGGVKVDGDLEVTGDVILSGDINEHHNSLLGLQGGDATAAEFYHLTKDIHDGLYSGSPLIGLGDPNGTHLQVDYGGASISVDGVLETPNLVASDYFNVTGGITNLGYGPATSRWEEVDFNGDGDFSLTKYGINEPENIRTTRYSGQPPIMWGYTIPWNSEKLVIAIDTTPYLQFETNGINIELFDLVSTDGNNAYVCWVGDSTLTVSSTSNVTDDPPTYADSVVPGVEPGVIFSRYDPTNDNIVMGVYNNSSNEIETVIWSISDSTADDSVSMTPGLSVGQNFGFDLSHSGQYAAVSYFDYADSNLYLKISSNYGNTWGSAILVKESTADYSYGDYSWLTIYDANNISVAYLTQDLNTGSISVRVITTSDGGTTWVYDQELLETQDANGHFDFQREYDWNADTINSSNMRFVTKDGLFESTDSGLTWLYEYIPNSGENGTRVVEAPALIYNGYDDGNSFQDTSRIMYKGGYVSNPINSNPPKSTRLDGEKLNVGGLKLESRAFTHVESIGSRSSRTQTMYSNTIDVGSLVNVDRQIHGRDSEYGQNFASGENEVQNESYDLYVRDIMKATPFQRVYISGSSTESYQSVQIWATSSAIYAVGPSTTTTLKFYKSTDGGKTWSVSTLSDASSFLRYATIVADQTNPDNVYVLYSYSTNEIRVIKSTNAGVSWGSSVSITSGRYAVGWYAQSYCDNDEIVVTARCNDASRRILRSGNGGSSWSANQVAPGEPFDLVSVYRRPSDGLIIASGQKSNEYTPMTTVDYGANWTEYPTGWTLQKASTFYNENDSLWFIFYSDPNTQQLKLATAQSDFSGGLTGQDWTSTYQVSSTGGYYDNPYVFYYYEDTTTDTGGGSVPRWTALSYATGWSPNSKRVMKLQAVDTYWNWRWQSVHVMESSGTGFIFDTDNIYCIGDDKVSERLYASYTVPSVRLSTGVNVKEFSSDGTFADNSDEAVPTEKAVKTYVDGEISSSGTSPLVTPHRIYQDSIYLMKDTYTLDWSNEWISGDSTSLVRVNSQLMKGAKLPNGNFVTVIQDEVFSPAVYIRKYDKYGNRVGTDTTINVSGVIADVKPLANGNVVVCSDVYAGILDSDGEVLIENVELDLGGPISLRAIELASGGFGLTYSDGENVNIALYDKNATYIKTSVLITRAGEFIEQVAPALCANGNVSVFHNSPTFADGVHYIICDQSGELVHNDAILDSTSTVVVGMDAVGLPNGNVVVSYSYPSDFSGDDDGYFGIITQDGNIVKERTQFVHATGNYKAYTTKLGYLINNHFVLIYNLIDDGPPTEDLEYIHFDSDGTIVEGPTNLYTEVQVQPGNVFSLQDGSFVMAWAYLDFTGAPVSEAHMDIKLAQQTGIDVDGYMALGNDATINDSRDSDRGYLLNIDHNFPSEASLVTTGMRMTLNSQATTNYGMSVSANNTLATSQTTLVGATVTANSSVSSGTLTTINGMAITTVPNNDNSTITTVMGIDNSMTTGFGMSGCVIGTMIGEQIQLLKWGSGDVSITDAYGVLVKSPGYNPSGTTDNLYGLYIEDQGQAGFTVDYNLYSAGSGTLNLFEGSVQVAETLIVDNIDSTAVVFSGDIRCDDLYTSGDTIYLGSNTQMTEISGGGLEVNGPGDFQSMAVGSAASPLSAASLYINEDFNVSAATYGAYINSENIANFDIPFTATAGLGVNVQQSTSTLQNIVEGANIGVNIAADSAVVTTVAAVKATAFVTADNTTITDMISGDFKVSPANSMNNAVVGSMIGGRFQILGAGSGDVDVTNGFGVLIQTPSFNSTGVTDKLYGLYVQDQSTVGFTTDYNLYSAGVSSTNKFEGVIEVGNDIDSSALVVTGVTIANDIHCDDLYNSDIYTSSIHEFGQTQDSIVLFGGTVSLYKDGAARLSTAGDGVNFLGGWTHFWDAIQTNQASTVMSGNTFRLFTNVNSGVLRIGANNGSGVYQDGILMTGGGSTSLSYNGNKSLETLEDGIKLNDEIDITTDSTGIVVVGDIHCDDLYTSGDTIYLGTTPLTQASGGGLEVPSGSIVASGGQLDVGDSGVTAGVINVIGIEGTAGTVEAVDSNITIRSGGSINIQVAGTESAIFCNNNFEVELSYDGTPKFATTATGASVTGDLDVSDDLTVGGTFGWTYSDIIDTTGETSIILTSSIPSTATEIEVLFNAVTTDTNSEPPIVRLGDAGGVETSGYSGVIRGSTGSDTVTDGFYTFRPTGWSAGEQLHTNMRLTRWCPDQNEWFADCISNEGTTMAFFSGSKTTSQPLTTIQVTTPTGTDLIDSGSFRVRYR